ncbi:hypothetical protein HG530_012646 [Fusarium avenaceum]|nr:hypothetical protein HG530_012646 [Fusarium avenaceum]
MIHDLPLEPQLLAYQSLQRHSNSTSIVKRPPQLVKLDVEAPALLTFGLGLSGLFLKRPVLKRSPRKFDEERLAVKRLVEHDAARCAVFECRAFFSEKKAHDGVGARDQSTLDLFQPLVGLNLTLELLVDVSPKRRLKLGNPVTLVSNAAGGMWVSMRIGTFLLIVELFQKRPHGAGLQKLVICSLGLLVVGDVVGIELAKLGAHVAIVDLEYGVAAIEVEVHDGRHSLRDYALDLDRDFA